MPCRNEAVEQKMADAENVQGLTNDTADMGYAQALKYGQDLARLFTLEKAKRHELELANQKLQAIVGTAPNGLAVINETMTIVEANPCFEALVEQKGNCAGRLLTDVLPSPELAAALEIASREGTHMTEVEVVLDKPLNRTLHVGGAPLTAGDTQGWVISLHDLTERKRLDGLKEEFINIAAHELRTPLAIILGYTSVLRESMQDSDDPVAVTSIEAVIRAASQLKIVINEIVEFAAARSRTASDVNIDSFDLWEMLRHTANSISHQAGFKGVDIAVQAAEGKLMVTGDRVMLAQAIGYLLENAVKFNRPGGHVYVRAFQKNSQTVLEIEDTGIGIPHAELEKIFDAFYQVEEHMTRAEGGLGMGLTMAKRSVELHGGQISVESSLGQGSCFRVTLPTSGAPMPIPLQSRVDAAHQQTLAYGHDLARIFVAHQTLIRRLSQISQLGGELVGHLERLPALDTAEEKDTLLDEVRALAAKIADGARDGEREKITR
jgi:two-component system, OmpR family, phosphate regulon sensor histidine kinase PhoR